LAAAILFGRQSGAPLCAPFFIFFALDWDTLFDASDGSLGLGILAVHKHLRDARSLSSLKLQAFAVRPSPASYPALT